MADGEPDSPVSLDGSFFIDESYVSRIYTFGPHKLEVFCLQSSSTDYDLTGQLIWPGAELLNDYLWEHSKSMAQLDTIELGSGVGLTGLLCAHFCRKVVLTDHNDVVLRVLERNIELQAVDSSSGQIASVECRKLEWGSEAQLKLIAESHPEGFDIILGADICYYQDSIPLLFRTVQQLMSLRSKGACTFILAYISRSRSMDAALLAAASNFNMKLKEASGTRRRVSGGTYEGVVYEITV